MFRPRPSELTAVPQYGSKPKGPQPKPHALNPSRLEAFDDSSSNTASYEGSPVQLGNYYHSHSGTQHHSLHSEDANAYFSHAPIFTAVGASPSESPLELTRSPGPDQAVQPHSGAGNFEPLAGTLPNEYPYQRPPDRFPFSGSETYAAAAIRG